MVVYIKLTKEQHELLKALVNHVAGFDSVCDLMGEKGAELLGFSASNDLTDDEIDKTIDLENSLYEAIETPMDIDKENRRIQREIDLDD